MNYAHADGIWTSSGGVITQRLDYNRRARPELNELHLNEVAGLGSMTADYPELPSNTIWGVPVWRSQLNGYTSLSPASANVNYDGLNPLRTDTPYNLNNLAPTTDVHRSVNEWQILESALGQAGLLVIPRYSQEVHPSTPEMFAVLTTPISTSITPVGTEYRVVVTSDPTAAPPFDATTLNPATATFGAPTMVPPTHYEDVGGNRVFYFPLSAVDPRVAAPCFKGTTTGSVPQTVSMCGGLPAVPITGAPATSPPGTPIPLFVSATAGESYTWAVTKNGAPYGTGGAGPTFSFTPDTNGTYVVTLTVTYSTGGVSFDSKTIVVSNVPAALAILGITGPIHPIAKGTAATVTATFRDAAGANPHSCTFAWDDSPTTPTVTPGVVTETNGSCTASFTYANVGVYSVTVTVTNGSGVSNSGLFEFVVVYDPAAGFITGGGWIDSPVGACSLTPACESATGKASFGFVARYQQGATVPTGQTEFQFKAGGINFRSTSYESLVVVGARAQYRGTGTVNGVAGYSFILTAVDGDGPGGGGVDKFRIKIMGPGVGEIYDNKRGESDDMDRTDPQALGGGSITIHRN